MSVDNKIYINFWLNYTLLTLIKFKYEEIEKKLKMRIC